MNAKQQFGDEVSVRRYEYADGEVLAADFGRTTDASVDVVDDTAIVVVDGEQYEVTVDGDADALMNNGVLTVEVEA